ncbi:hypothetical protein GGX14DRAFT_359868, partial [Mycena pura]
RTTESMSAVMKSAPTNKTDRNEYLKQHGLHDFEHFLWEFRNSDPYKAAGYDCLHFFDAGIWGRHMWVLLKTHLQKEHLALKFNSNKFPRWRDLDHFPSPTTIEYSDGQTFLDILTCSLPCLVQVLPPNSCLVKLVRAMQKVRVMLGLDLTTEMRLNYLLGFINEYEKICKAVSQTHEKSLNFLKQHFLGHAVENFKMKGTSRNMNTRVGEGFQQEVSAQYTKTNGRNAEHQISIMDENEETMARLDMLVEMWQKSQAEAEADAERDKDSTLSLGSESRGRWQLGSPEPRMTTVRFEATNRDNPACRDFNMRLREYLARYQPRHPVDLETDIHPCKVLYVNYESKVNWSNARDILRCNPVFHGRPRYDSIIYEALNEPLAMGKLEVVFRCYLPRKATLDLALISPYRKSTFAPKTRTDCPVREWDTGTIFISLEHVTRGALLCPIFGASREVFYVIDCIDEDMFLRVNNIE